MTEGMRRQVLNYLRAKVDERKRVEKALEWHVEEANKERHNLDTLNAEIEQHCKDFDVSVEEACPKPDMSSTGTVTAVQSDNVQIIYKW